MWPPEGEKVNLAIVLILVTCSPRALYFNPDPKPNAILFHISARFMTRYPTVAPFFFSEDWWVYTVDIFISFQSGVYITPMSCYDRSKNHMICLMPMRAVHCSLILVRFTHTVVVGHTSAFVGVTVRQNIVSIAPRHVFITTSPNMLKTDVQEWLRQNNFSRRPVSIYSRVMTPVCRRPGRMLD